MFEKQRIKLGGTEEDIVKGGRDLFSLLPKAFEGIEKIGVRIFNLNPSFIYFYVACFYLA